MHIKQGSYTNAVASIKDMSSMLEGVKIDEKTKKSIENDIKLLEKQLEEAKNEGKEIIK